MNKYNIDFNKLREIEPGLSPAGRRNYPWSKSLFDNFSDDEIRQTEVCIDWLKEKKVQKTISKKNSSTSIKQLIRREMNTYICSGAVVAAILYLGLKYEPVEDGSLFVYVNIGSKELYKNDPRKAEEREQRKLYHHCRRI